MFLDACKCTECSQFLNINFFFFNYLDTVYAIKFCINFIHLRECSHWLLLEMEE